MERRNEHLAIEIQEPRADEATIRGDSLFVHLMDGRTISVPLVWYPRLWHGTERERENLEIVGEGAYIHWPDLDEDLTVTGILAGRPSGERQRQPLFNPEGLWAGQGAERLAGGDCRRQT